MSVLAELVFAALLIFLAFGVVHLVRAGVESMFEAWPPVPPQAPTGPADIRSRSGCGPDLSGRADGFPSPFPRRPGRAVRGGR